MTWRHLNPQQEKAHFSRRLWDLTHRAKPWPRNLKQEVPWVGSFPTTFQGPPRSHRGTATQGPSWAPHGFGAVPVLTAAAATKTPARCVRPRRVQGGRRADDTGSGMPRATSRSSTL